MSRDDTQAWLDALAGRPAERNSPAAREANLLRMEILARSGADAVPLPGQDAAREAELIARARREGLLPAEGSASAVPGGHGSASRGLRRTGWNSEWSGGLL